MGVPARVNRIVIALAIAGIVVLAACGGGGGEQPAPSPTPSATAEDGAELSREQIIERALEIMEAQPDNRPDGSTATATRMTEREAVEAIQRAGVSGRPATPVAEHPVWLVEIRGEFVGLILGPARQGAYFLILGVDGVTHSGGVPA